MHSPTQNDAFLVFPGGECVPIDGPLRVAHLRDGWYVIGRNSTVPCGSERAARDVLAQLLRDESPHARAAEALHSIEATVGPYESSPEEDDGDRDRARDDAPGPGSAPARDRR